MGKSRREVLAAGAVVWRVVGRRLEVLLIHRPRYDDWSWPKGKLDSKDEPLPLCAVREVQEETGVPVLLGAKLPTVRYKLPGGAKKVRSEEHTSELQSRGHLVCRLLLEKKKGEWHTLPRALDSR